MSNENIPFWGPCPKEQLVQGGNPIPWHGYGEKGSKFGLSKRRRISIIFLSVPYNLYIYTCIYLHGSSPIVVCVSLRGKSSHSCCLMWPGICPRVCTGGGEASPSGRPAPVYRPILVLEAVHELGVSLWATKYCNPCSKLEFPTLLDFPTSEYWLQSSFWTLP